MNIVTSFFGSASKSFLRMGVRVTPSWAFTGCIPTTPMAPVAIRATPSTIAVRFIVILPSGFLNRHSPDELWNGVDDSKWLDFREEYWPLRAVRACTESGVLIQ